MAKLAAFLERLAEKAAAREAEERGGNALSGDAADGGPGASSSSLYAKRGYWDDRYAEGAIGAAADKGELSNEWCGANHLSGKCHLIYCFLSAPVVRIYPFRAGRKAAWRAWHARVPPPQVRRLRCASGPDLSAFLAGRRAEALLPH